MHSGEEDAPSTPPDGELLEPGPIFLVRGVEVDPAQLGYAMVHNYALYFWRPYLGSTAFALWELLLSFCYGARDTAHPSISRLARVLTNSDHSRAVVTGRRRADGSPTGRRNDGALGILLREHVVSVRCRGRGPTLHYTFRVLKVLPLLRPDQVASLCPGLQLDHENWLERYGIDSQTYCDAFAADADADAAPDITSDGTGTTPGADGPQSDAPGSNGAAGRSTKYTHLENPEEKWWLSVLSELQLSLSRSGFQTCLAGSRAVSFSDGVLTVVAPGKLAREILEERLVRVILPLATEMSRGAVSRVVFLAPDDA